tara:strand:+ start:56 stop:331 length:276 start_codon:yes stop_codon:yes gene_type:complete
MVKDKIIALIESNVNVEYISIRDRTAGHKHHKHYDGGGHYKLHVVSDDFSNMSLLKRHQIIYKLVNHMIQKEIHALSMITQTIAEYKNSLK